MNIKDKIVQSIRGVATEKQEVEKIKEKAIVRQADGTYREECNYDHH